MKPTLKGGLDKISGQELTKGAELMLGVSMKTYIRAVDTKKEREAQLIDRVHANMSERKGVKKKKKRSELWEQMQSQ